MVDDIGFTPALHNAYMRKPQSHLSALSDSAEPGILARHVPRSALRK
jgi:hypothetical protein